MIVHPFSRESTIEEIASTAVERGLRSIVERATIGSGGCGAIAQRMVERSIAEMPVWAVVLSGGRIRWGFIDAVMRAANVEARLRASWEKIKTRARLR